MNTQLDYEAAQVYIDAGCRVDGRNIVGSVETVVGAIELLIGDRAPLSLEALKTRKGIGAEWVNFKPLDILKDSGWGTDREGNLVGSNYEIRRVANVIATLFEE